MLSKKIKNNNGITLVALVITIIILLILATISIQSLTNTGLFKKAQEAKEKTQNAEENQAKTLNEYEDELNKYISGDVKTPIKKVTDNIDSVLSTTDNTKLEDAYGNKIVVPAGFKIVSDSTTGNATTVNNGIVIEDATTGATAGSQFVWVPVGTIYTSIEHTEANKRVITLGRYDFDEITGAEKIYVGDYVEEDRGDTTVALKNYGNKIAQNITDFKNSVTINGGYYIGRYEARKNISGTITEVGTDTVWNSITQPNAAIQAQNMYNSTKFTSDLMNSYAWDTATLFLQTCGTNPTYSRKNSVNTGSMAQTGTNNQSTKDIQCNVYDMASNVYEWTTETSIDSDSPCVGRGGAYDYSYNYTSSRNNGSVSDSYGNVGFRPLLFVGLNS